MAQAGVSGHSIVSYLAHRATSAARRGRRALISSTQESPYKIVHQRPPTMVTSEERKLRKKNKKLKRQLRKYKQKYKLARGASRQASNKTPTTYEEIMAQLQKVARDTEDRKAEQRITDAADKARARCMARDRDADSRDSEAMRRGAIDATEFAKRAEARREQRRIELDAVDKTRDADLAALRRSFRKRDEAAGVAVGSDSSSDSSGDSSAESSDEE